MKALRGLGLVLGVMASAAVTGILIGSATHHVVGNRMGPWILARSAGVASYLLLVALVLMGLLLSHPSRAAWRVPSVTTRIRIHIAFAAGTLVFTAMHVVALAMDKWAGVGWLGVVLPMHASYRPLPVTLGIIGLWTGLAAGITAAMAGRLPRRAWWPIHKVAAGSLVLVWVHGVLAGSDTAALLTLYVLTGAAVFGVAASRYTARSSADRLAEVRR